MAMVSCPECNSQVSSLAAMCPQCGTPIAEAGGSVAAGAPLTTVQETSKRLKVHIIFSSVAFWVGLVWFFVGVEAVEQGGEPAITPVILIVAGLFWYVVTKFRIWWHHK